MAYGLLIVEDELIERMVLKKTLQKKLEGQCEIFEAQNGKEAVEIFKREEIQIAILDIGMPGMNGIQAAEIMRKERPECCLIFLTAYDRFDYAKKAVSVQAMEYLLKPYSNKEIISVVETAIHMVSEYTKWFAGQSDQLLALRKIMTARADEPVAFAEAEAEETAEDPACSRLSVLNSMIEEYIRKNYMFEISMQDAARAVNYSEPYFCKMFKLQYGQNFTSYLTEYRIAEAKKLLHQPQVNVKEVGIRVGYPDNNYFTKVFKRMTGVNPSEYRAEALLQL